MRVSISILTLSLFAAVSVGAAQAADLDGPITGGVGGYYGNIHAGGFGYFNDLGGDSARIPGVNIGAKLAHDSADSPWGWQLDSDYSHVEFDWIKPSITDVDGHIGISDSAGHLTYRPNATSKIGLFAGYGTLTFGIEDTSGGTFDLFDDTGLVDASVTLGMAGIGVEGLTELTDSTWVQGRLGLVDPIRLSATLSDGVTRWTGSKTDVLGEDVGFNVSGSLHHRFTDNVSARAEASYVRLGVTSDSDIDVLALAFGGNYTFDSLPLSLGATGGYSRIGVDGESSDGFTASSRLTYSFGEPSSGSTGKLFRSGAVGLTPF